MRTEMRKRCTEPITAKFSNVKQIMLKVVYMMQSAMRWWRFHAIPLMPVIIGEEVAPPTPSDTFTHLN